MVTADSMQELESVGLLKTKDNLKPRDFEWSDMSRLPYLSAVIKEGLRLFGPVGAIPRVAEQDMEICGYKVPKVGSFRQI